jgi:hypothetical protein
MATVVKCSNFTYMIRTKHCVKQFACLSFGGNATGGPGSDSGSWAWLNVSASCSILWLDSSIASAERSSNVTRSTVEQRKDTGFHTPHQITHIKMGTADSHSHTSESTMTNSTVTNVLHDTILRLYQDILLFQNVMRFHQTCVTVISFMSSFCKNKCWTAKYTDLL